MFKINNKIYENETAEIYEDTDIVVRSKRIDENNISVTISINNKDIDLLCEENINIPLIK